MLSVVFSAIIETIQDIPQFILPAVLMTLEHVIPHNGGHTAMPTDNADYIVLPVNQRMRRVKSTLGACKHIRGTGFHRPTPFHKPVDIVTDLEPHNTVRSEIRSNLHHDGKNHGAPLSLFIKIATEKFAHLRFYGGPVSLST